jgi:hypothetical protein
MKKIIILIIAILSIAVNAQAVTIEELLWQALKYQYVVKYVPGEGVLVPTAQRILPAVISAGGTGATKFAFDLTGMGLSAVLSNLLCADALDNENDNSKASIQNAMGKQAENWTRNFVKRKFVSDVYQGVDGEWAYIPSNMKSTFQTKYLYTTDFKTCPVNYCELKAWYSLYYYRERADAYKDMTEELDSSNEFSSWWEIKNVTTNDPSYGGSYACTGGFTCQWQYDTTIYEGYYIIPENYVYNESYLAPFITSDNVQGRKIKYYFVQIYLIQTHEGETTHNYYYMFSFYASDEYVPSKDIEIEAVIQALNETGITTNQINALASTYGDVFSNTENTHRSDPAYGSTEKDIIDNTTIYVTNNISNVVNETVNNYDYTSSTGVTYINSQGDPNQYDGGEGSQGSFTGGSYTQQRAGSAFEPLYDDFETLFSNFITSMKATSLFGLQSSLFSELPTSEICTYELDCGSYGKHEISFCDWSTGLTILKAIILLAFSGCAVRIVMLKG